MTEKIKKNGDIRLCADYKVTINNQLQDKRYPIPRIEDIFNKMKNGKCFCTLDVFEAYLHVDDESPRLQTISTHRGTYLAKRLFCGTKTAPNEFHKVIDQIVHNLEDTTAYFDNTRIMVQGSSIKESQPTQNVTSPARIQTRRRGIKQCSSSQGKLLFIRVSLFIRYLIEMGM
ncbi:uncharacterized protein K02A2.6-like [Zophobas morio]|uniref:uncharacterized protein K02A2.6-like n=1 Tax=Zophobas morio TaxID=2755281 RepID=UPI003083AAD1